MSPARAWALALALSAATAAAVIAVASALERRAPSGGSRSLPTDKVEVRQRVGPDALAEAMRLGVAQRIRARVQGHSPIDGNGLAREALERVCHRNAERLLGLAPPEGR